MTYEWGPKVSLSFAAAADLSAKQYRVLVKSNRQVNVASVAGTGFAILQNAPKLGRTAECLISAGATKLIAGGTINEGDWLTSDANGAAVTAVVATDKSKIVFGRALESAVAGDIFPAMVNFAGAFPSTDT